MRYVTSLIRVLFLAAFIFLLYEGKMMLWLILFAVSLLAAIFLGRIYCSYACPMNTLMIPTERFSKMMKLQTAVTPKILSAKFAWLTFIVSIAVMLFGKKILHKDIPILLIWLVISILITLKFRPAVFHNFICPFGALQQFFGRFAKTSFKVSNENCMGCRLCEKVCPTDAIKVGEVDKKAFIETSHCLQCSSCGQVCPNNAVHYTK